jgi:hypothetical protein
MSAQTVTIQVDPATAAILQTLKARAEAEGVSLDALLLPLAEGTNGKAVLQENPPPRNEAMLQALRESEELLKDMPVRGSTEETLKMIREARAGGMWGYESTE